MPRPSDAKMVAAGRSDAERARPAALFRLGPGLSITCGPDTMDRLSGHRDPRLGRNPYPRAPAVQGAKYAHQLHGLLATQGVAPSNILLAFRPQSFDLDLT